MIGLEEVQDGVWTVLYYETLPGRFNERTRAITGAPSLKKDFYRFPRTKCHLPSRLYGAATPRRPISLHAHSLRRAAGTSTPRGRSTTSRLGPPGSDLPFFR